MLPGVPNYSFIVRFRPTGPWRFGPDSGARDRVDFLYHSDAVFSAVTSAMAHLGFLEEWLDATARANGEPAVRFSSFYPFQRELLFVAPPRNLWPPLESAKVRYKAARFVPVSALQPLLGGSAELEEDRWAVDGESECLVPAERNSQPGPFRMTLRSNAAVDRLEPGKIDPHSTACLEYSPGAGLWTLLVFSNGESLEKWEGRVRSALRLLADSGFGGERSRGWGRSYPPEWQRCQSEASPELPEGAELAYWLLSLYIPAESDSVDWRRGSYATISRSGRIESPSRWGEPKRATPMIAEGSVLLAGRSPQGVARDLAPEGFPHPVFRAGFAVSLPIAWRTAV